MLSDFAVNYALDSRPLGCSAGSKRFALANRRQQHIQTDSDVALSVATGKSTPRAMTADPRPMSAAPLDGTPIRLFVSAGSVIASFWSEERCQKTFGVGCYRAGWYLLHDDTIELDDPLGWEPLLHGHPCCKNDAVSLTPEPVPF